MSSAIYTADLSTPSTQTSPIFGRDEEMKRNNAGGFTFMLDKWGILDRFLVIGSENGNYYVGEKDLTRSAYSTIISCIKEDGIKTLNRAVEYSLSGRAPKNDPAVVVLGLAASFGDATTQAAAYEMLPRVARTGTWLFLFVSILDSYGKWNAAAKRGVSKWYNWKQVDDVAYQALKYQQRNGWSHRDVLRLSHAKPNSDQHSDLFAYIVGKQVQTSKLPPLVVAFEMLKKADSKAEVLSLIETNAGISWEMVPTRWLSDADVLSALLPKMGMTALIRKLGILTKHGVITPFSEGLKTVVSKISDTKSLLAQRVHPIVILQALKQYSSGGGERSSASWKPNQQVVDALDAAFYSAFSNCQTTQENILVGVDCSGSMFGASVNGSPSLNSADVAAVMALAIIKNQSNYWIMGFNDKMQELNISPNMRLDAVLKVMEKFPWGGTDCALPITTAMSRKMNVDKFITITDNETWFGVIHPSEALREYRSKFNPLAKQIVIATSVSEFSIADPLDGGMLDVAGFDSSTPEIISQF